MTIEELRAEIQADLGSDVVSLGISDATIDLKITEALRKISAYAPRNIFGTFEGSSIQMPEGTTCVLDVLSGDIASSATYTDNDVFSWSTIMMNSGSSAYDPFTILSMRNQVRTLQGFVRLKDWNYIKETRMLYLSGVDNTQVVVRYMMPYTSVEQVVDEMVVQKMKEYALALCKIIEGLIRRKLQNTPGAMSLDGDSLVSEGTSEKDRLDSELPQIFKYLRMGLRV